MEKRRTIRVISLIFIMLMIIRAIEIIFIKTDQTWIGENILHKICCILLIWVALDMLRLHWSDLGFSKKGLFAGLKYGLALGISTFFSFLCCGVYCFVCNGETPIFTVLHYEFFTYAVAYKWQFFAGSDSVRYWQYYKCLCRRGAV